MSWIEIDGVPEKSLPAHAQDGRSGDRVSMLEGALLWVQDGRATVVPWTEVLGTFEHAGRGYVLVARRPPAQPWIAISPAMIGGDDVSSFLARLDERGAAGGYRDAVRRRRQDLSLDALRAQVMAREAVPGALEVPSTIMLGVSYPGLAFAQLIILGIGVAVGYAGFIVPLALAPNEPGAMLIGYPLLFGGMLGGAWAAIAFGRSWREAKNRTLPRQRVLVLAPDGCIVGFSTGARAMRWPEVGRFAIERSPTTYEEALTVYDSDARRLGEIDAAWLDAPLSLVVRVAEEYRAAARD